MAKNIPKRTAREPSPREREIVEGIKRGLADMKAGRVISHRAAMRRLRATVARIVAAKP
jgi:predicted transcriptional regulator